MGWGKSECSLADCNQRQQLKGAAEGSIITSRRWEQFHVSHVEINQVREASVKHSREGGKKEAEGGEKNSAFLISPSIIQLVCLHHLCDWWIIWIYPSVL